MTANFWVYDNWTINKAIVHRGGCSYCNEGAGIHANPSGRNSKWHGPFETASSALSKARSLQRLRTDGCSSCSPL